MFLYYLRIVGFNRLVWGYPGIIGKIVQEGYLVKKLLFGAFGQESFVGIMHIFVSSANGTFWLCCCSVAQSCLTLCDPMDCSMTGLPVLHYLPELAQTHVLRVSDAIQPSHPLSPLSLPALNLSQHQAFFNVLALHIRWLKYWSFSISPPNEYSGLISFRIDWFDLFAVQGTLKESSPSP